MTGGLLLGHRPDAGGRPVRFLRTLPEGVRALLHADGLIAAVGNVLPFATIGLGWVAPAILGLVIGLIFRASRPKRA